MKKESISDVSFRANIIHKTTSKNDVVLYEDHRTILNVLYHLREKRKIIDPIDIYMFDYHDDFCHPRQEAIKNIHKFLKKPSKESLHLLVEFNLNCLDDDWVKAGMELGFINNVFLFNCGKEREGISEAYKTKKFGTKTLYYLGNIWDALGFRGILNDVVKYEQNEVLTKFGWILEDGKYSFQPNNKFILDIDLDCFSAKILDKTIAIPDEIIIPKLVETSRQNYHYYFNSQSLIKDLIEHSEIVTICFENGCCGGIRQSQQIFSMVDRVLFDGELSE